MLLAMSSVLMNQQYWSWRREGTPEGKRRGRNKITSRILEKVIKNYVILYVFKMIHYICVHTNYICIKYL